MSFCRSRGAFIFTIDGSAECSLYCKLSLKFLLRGFRIQFLPTVRLKAFLAKGIELVEC